MSPVFLVRHGQTAWNKDQIFRGTMDVPLDDFGRKQAQAVGDALQRWNLAGPLIVSSPLARARETAEIAGAALAGAQLLLDPAFTDLDFGLWQGKAKADIAEQDPARYAQWLAEPGAVTFPGGGSLAAVADRAEAALRRLVQNEQNRDIVVVSHRVVNKVLLCRLLGAGFGAFWKIKQDTACLNTLYYGNSSFIVGTMNDTCHLRHLHQADPGDF